MLSDKMRQLPSAAAIPTPRSIDPMHSADQTTELVPLFVRSPVGVSDEGMT